MKTPSGLRILLTSLKTPGKSLTQCMERQEVTWQRQESSEVGTRTKTEK